MNPLIRPASVAAFSPIKRYTAAFPGGGNRIQTRRIASADPAARRRKDGASSKSESAWRTDSEPRKVVISVI